MKIYEEKVFRYTMTTPKEKISEKLKSDKKTREE